MTPGPIRDAEHDVPAPEPPRNPMKWFCLGWVIAFAGIFGGLVWALIF